MLSDTNLWVSNIAYCENNSICLGCYLKIDGLLLLLDTIPPGHSCGIYCVEVQLYTGDGTNRYDRKGVLKSNSPSGPEEKQAIGYVVTFPFLTQTVSQSRTRRKGSKVEPLMFSTGSKYVRNKCQEHCGNPSKGSCKCNQGHNFPFCLY